MFCLPEDNLIILVGNYGSGKTEVSVNLAFASTEAGRSTSIADLDIVNPYFRCREAVDAMQNKGIRVVIPSGANTWADLPIILPEIKGMLQPGENAVNIFDVGGDEVGAKILSSLKEALQGKPYALWMVINAKRPFTDTVDGCLRMLDGIENTSRLKATGLVANTHLMHETETATILEGIELTEKVSRKSGLPIAVLAVMEPLVDTLNPDELGLNVLPMKRRMLPPWIKPSSAGILPKPGRPVPIGRTLEGES